MRATDSRLIVVAERTEDLSPEVLHALDQLTAPDAVGNPGANLVLLGHAGIHEHLAAPTLDSLRQRIRLRAELEPFTEAELQDYLRHQTARAKGNYDQIFAPGTVAALYRYSNGVARLVNTLCESALDIAAVQHQKQLTADLVAKTAVSLLGLADSTPAARPAAPPAPVAAPPVEVRPAARVLTPAPPAVIVERRSEPRAIPVPVPASPPPSAQAAELPPAPPPPAPAPSPVVPVATAPAAPAKPVVPVATAPAAPAKPVVPAATTPAVPAKPVEVELEFDGGATDVADVAVADFPVLTDAIEPPAPAKPATPAPPPAATAPPPAKPLPSAPAAAAAPPSRPSVKPASRVETAYTATRPGTRSTPAPAAPAAPPTTTPLPHVAAAAAAAAKPKPPAAAPADPHADDELRQTQTMRAIAGAKSIDDISEFDAETLFSDAELDLVSAALASAADWPDDDEPTAAPVPAPAPPRSATAKAAPAPAPSRPAAAKAAPQAEEDPFDLFGLGDDAPLELIDDSTLPPSTRKTATR
jgi:hypothetical protein